jgi:hypothetical protein
MDESRAINGLMRGMGTSPGLKRSAQTDPDGGDGGGSGGYQPLDWEEVDEEAIRGRHRRRRGVADRDEAPPSELEQELDRLRTVGEAPQHDIQAQRGRNHYQQQTTTTVRRKAADSASDDTVEQPSSDG